MLADGVRDKLSGLSLTLSSNDGGPGLLLLDQHVELGFLRHLLGNLLLLNGHGELVGELQMGDGHIVEDETELT